jgi:hypothetical protein
MQLKFAWQVVRLAELNCLTTAQQERRGARNKRARSQQDHHEQWASLPSRGVNAKSALMYLMKPSVSTSHWFSAQILAIRSLPLRL